MSRRSKLFVTGIASLGVALWIVGLLPSLWARPKPDGRFFWPSPGGLTLHVLARSTNDPPTWTAFCLSNRTSGKFFYTVTQFEDYTNGSWRCGFSYFDPTPTNVPWLMYPNARGEIAARTADKFYIVCTSTTPWRIRLGCFTVTRRDTVQMTIEKFRAKVRKLPNQMPAVSRGRRYELTSETIIP